MILFVASFLLLFVEIALIRWIPAYVRLLAYFSNFILLATFLGGGLGCFLAGRRRNLFIWFPMTLLVTVAAVDWLRLEVAIPSTSSIYFSSGTAEKVVSVESTLLLPLLFAIVALLFVSLGQRMGRELAAARPPLRGYTINLLGSLAGVALFALLSWLQLPPAAWFAVAGAAAIPLLIDRRTAVTAVNVGLLAASVFVVYRMERGSLWSPYYKITVSQDRNDTVVEVNNIFHQSMAPIDKKEYFYQWPYAVFGDHFDDVLILGAGSGTDVAAALRHGAKHVDAVEIDPVILRLGAERHPDHPYSDPRVTTVNDDARHYLATTTKRYDLIVFALIDSLTVQSSFSSVRLESYMFTRESFEAVRDHLKPRGVMALYNYFREKWLVDRLANTVVTVFKQEPLAHVHQERAYLAVMLAGPRLAELTAPPPLPALVIAYGQSQEPSPAKPLQADPSVAPATDDWPFLYMREPELPRHYLSALAIVLVLSVVSLALVSFGTAKAVPYRGDAAPSRGDAARHRGDAAPSRGDQERSVGRPFRGADAGPLGRTALHFFFLGAGFMLLETKSIVQFALLWGSTWSSASLAIASVLAMALAGAALASRRHGMATAPLAAVLIAFLILNYLLPVGRIAFESRLLESLFYAVLVFSPVLCAGLLFSSSFKTSSSTAADFGANLLGAMIGGVCEYLSLLTGYRFLLFLVAGCYALAILFAAVRRPALSQ